MQKFQIVDSQTTKKFASFFIVKLKISNQALGSSTFYGTIPHYPHHRTKKKDKKRKDNSSARAVNSSMIDFGGGGGIKEWGKGGGCSSRRYKPNPLALRRDALQYRVYIVVAKVKA